MCLDGAGWRLVSVPERVRMWAEVQESDGCPHYLRLAMAHEKVAVPAVEFAMGALLARALLPRAYRRDISHGEIVWHTHVLRSAGISNPCNAIREERRTIPKGGPGDHTFFQVNSEKQFVREDLRLAVHRQTELGEVIWPRPKAADPLSWGRSWPTGSSEMGSERQQGTTSAGPGFFEAVTGVSPRAPDTADQSDLINVLLEQLLQAKDALRNAEQHKEDKEAKEIQSKLEQERARSESVEAKTEIKRERILCRADFGNMLPGIADHSDLINVLLEQLLQTKDALRNAEQHEEDKEAKETQSELEQERTRSEFVEAKTEIKRERSRSCRPQRSDPVISVSPVRAPLKGKAPPAQPHRRLGAGS